jgi:hypothetical protein
MADKKYIEINNEWALSAEDICVALYRKTTSKKDGKPNYHVAGYYNNYEEALKRMVDMAIQPLKSIEYIVERINGLKSDIHAMLPSIADKAYKNQKRYPA